MKMEYYMTIKIYPKKPIDLIEKMYLNYFKKNAEMLDIWKKYPELLNYQKRNIEDIKDILKNKNISAFDVKNFRYLNMTTHTTFNEDHFNLRIFYRDDIEEIRLKSFYDEWVSGFERGWRDSSLISRIEYEREENIKPVDSLVETSSNKELQKILKGKTQLFIDAREEIQKEIEKRWFTPRVYPKELGYGSFPELHNEILIALGRMFSKPKVTEYDFYLFNNAEVYELNKDNSRILSVYPLCFDIKEVNDMHLELVKCDELMRAFFIHEMIEQTIYPDYVLDEEEYADWCLLPFAAFTSDAIRRETELIQKFHEETRQRAMIIGKEPYGYKDELKKLDSFYIENLENILKERDKNSKGYDTLKNWLETAKRYKKEYYN